MEHPAEVTVELSLGDDADSEELDEAVRTLRQDLLERDAEAVEVVETEPQDADGAKGIPFLAIGALLLKVANSEALKNVIDGLRLWVARKPSRSITVTYGTMSIQLTGPSNEQQERLVNDFLKHSTLTLPDARTDGSTG
jgi:hypothetical protein